MSPQELREALARAYWDQRHYEIGAFCRQLGDTWAVRRWVTDCYDRGLLKEMSCRT